MKNFLENEKTERVTGLGRRTREEIAKWNQMTALRFQTGGRHQTSPASLRGRFADDTDGLAGEEEELANLVERLDKASTACGMEISAEKTKLMTNNTSSINAEIKVNGQKLGTVTSFKYLGSDITGKSSKPKILSMIAQTKAALTRVKPIWIDKSISLSSKT